MTSWESKVEKRPVTWIVIGTVALVLFCWLIVMGLFGLRVATAGLVGKGQAHIQIQSASNRIAQYNHFFNLCASVQANESRLDELLKQQASAPNDFEKYRVGQAIAGTAGLRAEAIRQYNADARKDYTSGQFRDSDLPYQLRADSYPEGGRTSCGSD